MTAKKKLLEFLHIHPLKQMLHSTAADTSASSKTIKEALPPSSMDTFFMVPAD
jgi:hypothetical protein